MAMTQPQPAYAESRGALLDGLDERVRAEVRQRGIDPQRDAALVRRLAESVVLAHDERSLTGQVAPVPDVEAVVGELVARISGFGPLQPFLDDPSVEEIWINALSSASVQVRRPLYACGPQRVRSAERFAHQSAGCVTGAILGIGPEV